MTLKAFKSAVRPGMRIGVSDHWVERHRYTVRTVTKVQGNGFFFTQEGDATRYWMPFPKASALRFAGTCAHIGIGEKRWTLHLTPNGIVDHHRWERVRGSENECDAERRLAEEAAARGADMKAWWQQWFMRSDEWQDEIGHDADGSLDEQAVEAPAL